MDAEAAEEPPAGAGAGRRSRRRRAAAEACRGGAPEAPVEENRRRPADLAELEEALAAAKAPPTLVGRYSAGGANYMIFSDGSIEAETEDGAFRFASMDDFKAYLASERA